MLDVQGLANLGKKGNKSLRKTTFSLLSFPGILHYPATVLTHTLCCLLILVKGFALSFDRKRQGSSYSKVTCHEKLFSLTVFFKLYQLLGVVPEHQQWPSLFLYHLQWWRSQRWNYAGSYTHSSCSTHKWYREKLSGMGKWCNVTSCSLLLPRAMCKAGSQKVCFN